MLAAKFSIPYAVAAMVVRGSADVTSFYPQQVSNSQIRQLAQRVEVVADEGMSFRRYDYPAARVAVSLSNGRILEGSVTVQRGDAKNPVNHEELVGKFRFIAGDVLGEARTKQVIDTVAKLDKLGDVGELTALLGEN